tara:strand:+ start:4809 stop:5630 length:822 start_codon:yes stop_codon:yes gene_type:complete
MSTLELEHIKHSSSSSNNLSVNSDGTIAGVTIANTGSTNPISIATHVSNHEIAFTGSTHANIAANTGANPFYIQNLGAGDMFFQTNSTNRMHIDSVGRVRKLTQPSFSARGQDANWRAVPGNVGWSTIAGTSYSNTTGNYQMGTNFTTSGHYGAENIGNHFTNASGHFTAPVTGHYFFQIRMYLNRTTTYSPGIYLNPRINSLVIDGGSGGIQGSYLLERTTMSNSNNAYIPFGREDVYYMGANDTFTYSLNAEDVGFQIYGQYTEFKGYMIG